jgi:hypothetical protein
VHFFFSRVFPRESLTDEMGWDERMRREKHGNHLLLSGGDRSAAQRQKKEEKKKKTSAFS